MFIKVILFTLITSVNFLMIRSLEKKRWNAFFGSLIILLVSYLISYYYLPSPNGKIVVLLSLCIIPIHFFNYLLDNFSQIREGIVFLFFRLLRSRIFYLILTTFQLISILDLYDFFRS